MNNNFVKNSLWMGLAVVLTVTGCNKEDDPAPVNEGEELTTVEFTLTPTSGSPVMITYEDLDGEGGNAPVFTPSVLSLAANTTYETTLRFLNKNANPVEDITIEIEDDEPDEHEVFYTISSGLELTLQGRNTDVQGKPLGTEAGFKTGKASTAQGTVRITLKHKPPGEFGAKTDNDPITKGNTDVEVVFPTEIK